MSDPGKFSIDVADLAKRMDETLAAEGVSEDWRAAMAETFAQAVATASERINAEIMSLFDHAEWAVKRQGGVIFPRVDEADAMADQGLNDRVVVKRLIGKWFEVSS